MPKTHTNTFYSHTLAELGLEYAQNRTFMQKSPFTVIFE